MPSISSLLVSILKPPGKIDLKEGEELEIEIKKGVADRTSCVTSPEHKEIEEIIEDTEYGSL